MTRRTKQATTLLATAGLGILLFPDTARALIPVFDASSFAKAIEALVQGKKILDSTMKVEALGQRAATMVQTARSGWKGIGNLITQNITPNDSGAVPGWASAMNGSGDVFRSFVTATEGISANPAYPSAVAARGSVAAALASASIADGAMLTAMRTIGIARANQVTTDSAIRALETLATSTSNADNTQEATLNVISGAAVQNLRMQQSNQALMVSLAESNIPLNKLWRDERVASLNRDTRIQQSLSTSGAFPGNMADAFKNY